MGLKFRRGSTAQQSGSLAFGEPYVNTTLGTLVIGGATGDIVLSAGGTGSTGNFGAISGSGLDITGNANIAGNLTLGGAITIGDATADTVNVVASLSSSLIPQTTNAFDLGSATKIWRDLYISTGSIKFVEGNTVVKSLSAATLTALEVATGSSNVSVAALNSFSSSQLTQNSALATISGSLILTASANTVSVANLNTTTASLLIETANLESFTSSINTTIKTQLDSNTVVSGSSQITYTSISSIPAGIVSGAAQVTPLLPTGVVSGSAQTISNLPTGTISGSSQVTYASISSIPSGIISGSSQLSGTSITDLTIINLTTVNQTASVVFSSGSNRFGDAGNDTHSFTGSVQISGSIVTIGASTATSFNGAINSTNGVVSGSSQISHDSTTGYSANKHVDHTSVLISAGNGLSGGGDISSTRTLTLDSGSTHFTTGVKTTLNSNTVISGSSQITYANISSIPAGIVSGSSQTIANLPGGTISGSSQVVGSSITTNTVSFNGTSVALGGSGTIANLVSGSSQITAGSTTNFATDVKTRLDANTVVSGSGQVAIASTSGFGTYLNQAVLTTSAVTHGNLTINGTITATGDITAFFTSDIRHKNNVELIDNALDKVNALNGVTWEWNDDVDEVTKQTPKTGLIAQDVLDVLPEVVKTRENGFLALDYSKMVGLLVEAIKEQDIVIQKLKSDMIGLNTTITVFEDRMKEKGLL